MNYRITPINIEMIVAESIAELYKKTLKAKIYNVNKINILSGELVRGTMMRDASNRIELKLKPRWDHLPSGTSGALI